jgi:hypothetical protein
MKWYRKKTYFESLSSLIDLFESLVLKWIIDSNILAILEKSISYKWLFSWRHTKNDNHFYSQFSLSLSFTLADPSFACYCCGCATEVPSAMASNKKKVLSIFAQKKKGEPEFTSQKVDTLNRIVNAKEEVCDPIILQLLISKAEIMNLILGQTKMGRGTGGFQPEASGARAWDGHHGAERGET